MSTTLLPISVNIVLTEQIKVVGDIKQDLVVGNDDINVHIDEASARIAHWSVILAEANRQLSLKKLDNDVWMAQKKNIASASKDFKSEKAKEEKVLLDNVDEYGKKFKDIIDAEYSVEVIKGILDAFKAKKDMLVSLSANMRSEMERDLILKQWNDKVNNSKKT